MDPLTMYLLIPWVTFYCHLSSLEGGYIQFIVQNSLEWWCPVHSTAFNDLRGIRTNFHPWSLTRNLKLMASNFRFCTRKQNSQTYSSEPYEGYKYCHHTFSEYQDFRYLKRLVNHGPSGPSASSSSSTRLTMLGILWWIEPIAKLLLKKVTTHQLQQMGFLPSNTRTLPEDLEATALSSHEASKVAVHIRLSHLHDICLLTKEASLITQTYICIYMYIFAHIQIQIIITNHVSV